MDEVMDVDVDEVNRSIQFIPRRVHAFAYHFQAPHSQLPLVRPTRPSLYETVSFNRTSSFPHITISHTRTTPRSIMMNLLLLSSSHERRFSSLVLETITHNVSSSPPRLSRKTLVNHSRRCQSRNLAYQVEEMLSLLPQRYRSRSLLLYRWPIKCSARNVGHCHPPSCYLGLPTSAPRRSCLLKTGQDLQR